MSSLAASLVQTLIGYCSESSATRATTRVEARAKERVTARKGTTGMARMSPLPHEHQPLHKHNYRGPRRTSCLQQRPNTSMCQALMELLIRASIHSLMWPSSPLPSRRPRCYHRHHHHRRRRPHCTFQAKLWIHFNHTSLCLHRARHRARARSQISTFLHSTTLLVHTKPCRPLTFPQHIPSSPLSPPRSLPQPGCSTCLMRDGLTTITRRPHSPHGIVLTVTNRLCQLM